MQLLSCIVVEVPMFYTGLYVWKLAWCPMPMSSQHDQILAIVGQTDNAQQFYTQKCYTGSGHIQMWKTGVKSNKM